MRRIQSNGRGRDDVKVCVDVQQRASREEPERKDIFKSRTRDSMASIATRDNPDLPDSRAQCGEGVIDSDEE